MENFSRKFSRDNFEDLGINGKINLTYGVSGWAGFN
jgi:hypothetical protein